MLDQGAADAAILGIGVDVEVIEIPPVVADPEGGEAEDLVGLIGRDGDLDLGRVVVMEEAEVVAGQGFVRGGFGVIELGGAVVLAAHHVVFGEDVDAGGGGEVGGGGGADGDEG